MALTATAVQRDDWQNPAGHLALAPMAAAAEAAVANQGLRRLPLIRTIDRSRTLRYSQLPGTDADGPQESELADLRHQVALKTTAAKMLNERVRKLVADATAKDKQLAGLEDELLLTREDLAHRENENRSLQTSLDLITSENARLSGRIRESTVETEALRSRLENSKTTLFAAEAERDRLAVALREGSDLHRIESDALNSRLEAMTSRTAAMESLLVDVRKSLLARIEENGAAARKVVEATLARNAADQALGQLHDSLQTKEHQVQELEQTRSMLIAGAGTLLEAFETRVAALGEAEERAKSLAGRVAKAEANSVLARSKIESLNLKLQSEQAGAAEAGEAIKFLAKRVADAEANSIVAQSKIASLNLKLQNEQASRAVAEVALNKAQTDYSRLRRELDSIVKRTDTGPKQVRVRSAKSLLAATISF
jgi:chromosome segregation ATPase